MAVHVLGERLRPVSMPCAQGVNMCRGDRRMELLV